MKRKINFINGMPVEMPVLDEHGEEQRMHLSKLALQEYSDTGTLSSAKLQEANAEFLKVAKQHLLEDGAVGDSGE